MNTVSGTIETFTFLSTLQLPLERGLSLGFYFEYGQETCSEYGMEKLQSLSGGQEEMDPVTLVEIRKRRRVIA